MYEELKLKFTEVYRTAPTMLFSAPGRTELCGNHTDHQGGVVLAGAVNLETVAAVRPREDDRIRLLSEGYPLCELSLSSLEANAAEAGSTTALIRGVAAGFAFRGFHPVGFDACVCSSVLPGSGLSSSAAFEILLGTIQNSLSNAGLSAMQLAQIGQLAENRYYGKPSGLLDQAAAACGGVTFLNFAPDREPTAERIDFDFAAHGYALCVIDSGADHADLTGDYSAIPGELGQVSSFFGKHVLQEVDEGEFCRKLPELRQWIGERPVLRAMHIFEENRRVIRARDALLQEDMQAFLSALHDSGRSSQLYLQNIIPANGNQALAYTLACAERLLGGEGVCRVQGGGFAGTIQAFVPLEKTDMFCEEMNRLLGRDSCLVLQIRPHGGLLLECSE
ncbi:MAG: galactokinase [Oscillospiraceae bacterium]|nr:galactokinase [Oscillospiraceae bacterium]